jgi:hypothetical protein
MIAEAASDITHCPECGQPDNCGDCDHTPVPSEMYRPAPPKARNHCPALALNPDHFGR